MSGQVPQAPLTDLYTNTTSGLPASPTIMDAAMQAIIQTIGDNWTAFVNFQAGTRYTVDGGAFTDTTFVNTIDGGTFV